MLNWSEARPPTNNDCASAAWKVDLAPSSFHRLPAHRSPAGFAPPRCVIPSRYRLALKTSGGEACTKNLTVCGSA